MNFNHKAVKPNTTKRKLSYAQEIALKEAKQSKRLKGQRVSMKRQHTQIIDDNELSI